MGTTSNRIKRQDFQKDPKIRKSTKKLKKITKSRGIEVLKLIGGR